MVLAGFGERRLLEGFAVNDADDYVRATAIHYLVQIAPVTEHVKDFINERLVFDWAPVVRETIVGECAARKIPIERLPVDQIGHA